MTSAWLEFSPHASAAILSVSLFLPAVAYSLWLGVEFI